VGSLPPAAEQKRRASLSETDVTGTLAWSGGKTPVLQSGQPYCSRKEKWRCPPITSEGIEFLPVTLAEMRSAEFIMISTYLQKPPLVGRHVLGSFEVVRVLLAADRRLVQVERGDG